MFIPIWVIIIIIVMAVLYVKFVKDTHIDNEHKVKRHLERLSDEAKYIEKDVARGVYSLAWRMVIIKNYHAIDVIKSLRFSRDYTALDIAENFLSSVEEYKEEIEECIADLERNTGYNLNGYKEDIGTIELYTDWINKYNDKVMEIRSLITEVRSELE
ncbi:hypothetical protein [Enterobacter mori]|uniref:hypothetical protein n=1 Tax=Enterobacter mori TaxID=539813 RepID=UPI003AAC35EF